MSRAYVIEAQGKRRRRLSRQPVIVSGEGQRLISARCWYWTHVRGYAVIRRDKTIHILNAERQTVARIYLREVS